MYLKIKKDIWLVLKGSSPSNENSVINCSISFQPCQSFAHQIKISFIKSESFLTLHRQHGDYHSQGTET